jgi:hypothetical protein
VTSTSTANEPTEGHYGTTEMRLTLRGLLLCTVGLSSKIGSSSTLPLMESRDGNGYPRPDTRWVFTPLGYISGQNILPVGLLLGKNLHPMGKRVLERSAFTHNR